MGGLVGRLLGTLKSPIPPPLHHTHTHTHTPHTSNPTTTHTHLPHPTPRLCRHRTWTCRATVVTSAYTSSTCARPPPVHHPTPTPLPPRSAGTVDLSRYTLPTYLRIVTYKTSYYTFYLPVAAGLRLAGVEADAAYQLAEDICVRMGQYFQARIFLAFTDHYVPLFHVSPRVAGDFQVGRGLDSHSFDLIWI